MVRVGIVGIGFMGMIHYLAAQRLDNARVTAIVSRDPKKRAGDWRGIRGNFGPPGQLMDLRDLKAYSRLSELLADPDIDLVDICLPTSMHAQASLEALRAGKHVLVEKPIALSLEDAARMVEAAQQTGKLLLVGQVLAYVPEFAWALQLARSSAAGKLLAGHLDRIISKPDWSAEIADPAKTGGPAIDLHIHDAHYVTLIGGVPRAVYSRGVIENGVVTHLTTHYIYDSDGPACLTCSSGALCQKGREFTHGFELYFEKATVSYRLGSPLTVYWADGRTEQPKLMGGDDPTAAFTAELQAAVQAVVQGRAPQELSGELARLALALCYKEIESATSGRMVSVSMDTK
ncbi:MAG: Gfo/Idh/MocA family oxidoreductase [Gemmatales bacterium]|nr:Gfo/Idh/MocA family oxidoreductase [Gemmatales bacterium]MCS7159779.1 Gfo/Idh/MocA family oxidoreductase [Gemmatales bacterium]MDW8174977.1 Gfo/Idh/MocA family oxidoreductase [Gemmatales bacterium]MDW8221368.1 Gfo/Idh/MocA family oxidoreductase [Gemmatales bacterium]